MKLPLFVTISLLFISPLPIATGQTANRELKHLMVPSPNRNLGAYVSATDIERGADYPSVIRLKGQVEIAVPVCVRVNGDTSPLRCDGRFIIRADSAAMREDTGEIEIEGNAHIISTRF